MKLFIFRIETEIKKDNRIKYFITDQSISYLLGNKRFIRAATLSLFGRAAI
jgi:hypothetical protein